MARLTQDRIRRALGQIGEGWALDSLDYQLYPNTSHIHPHMCG